MFIVPSPCKERGFQPEAIVNFLALLGWHHEASQFATEENKMKGGEIYSMDELIRMFSLHGIKRTSVIVDESKLLWMNKHYFKQRLNQESYLSELAMDLQSEVCKRYK